MKITGLLFLTFFYINVNGQTWQWAKSAQGHGADYSWDISADQFGNSYTIGVFYDSIQFGNNITLQTDLGTWKYFVAKFDNSGNILWANKIDQGNSGFNYFDKGISIDTLQNCYVIGEFADSLKIGSTFITTTSYNDSCYDSWTGTWSPCVLYYQGIFIAKFNTNGNLIWLKKICESKFGYLYGNSIAIDKSSNCYITGAFTDTITLNNNTTLISFDSTTDIFIAKTDTNGNIQWIKKAGGNDVNADVGYDIVVDDFGNSFITGIFRDTATFDTIILPASTLRIFVAKYNSNGNCIWAKKINGVGYSKGIAVDQDGNCFITGTFNSQATFDTISLTSYAGAGDDIFIAKYSPTGNCLWAKNAGGYYFDEGRSVAVDKVGNSYITGDFRDVATFGNFTLTSNYIDIFVAKYDSVGTIKWVVKAGCINNYIDEGFGIALDNLGSVLITGLFEHTSLFGSYSLTSAGGTDIFVAKLFDNTVGLVENNVIENSTIVFPNPFTTETTVKADKNLKDATLTIYNSFGQQVKQIKNISGQTITLHRDNLPSGLYFLSLTQGNVIFTTDKLIIMNK